MLNFLISEAELMGKFPVISPSTSLGTGVILVFIVAGLVGTMVYSLRDNRD